MPPHTVSDRHGDGCHHLEQFSPGVRHEASRALGSGSEVFPRSRYRRGRSALPGPGVVSAGPVDPEKPWRRGNGPVGGRENNGGKRRVSLMPGYPEESAHGRRSSCSVSTVQRAECCGRAGASSCRPKKAGSCPAGNAAHLFTPLLDASWGTRSPSHVSFPMPGAACTSGHRQVPFDGCKLASTIQTSFLNHLVCLSASQVTAFHEGMERVALRPVSERIQRYIVGSVKPVRPKAFSTSAGAKACYSGKRRSEQMFAFFKKRLESLSVPGSGSYPFDPFSQRIFVRGDGDPQEIEILSADPAK